jgi:amidophosphoribosyltransferase
MPSVDELIAYNRTVDEVARLIGADWLVYQDLEDLIAAAHRGNPEVGEFDASCFSGEYVTGDVSAQYLDRLAAERCDEAKAERGRAFNSLVDLHDIA